MRTNILRKVVVGLCGPICVSGMLMGVSTSAVADHHGVEINVHTIGGAAVVQSQAQADTAPQRAGNVQVTLVQTTETEVIYWLDDYLKLTIPGYSTRVTDRTTVSNEVEIEAVRRGNPNGSVLPDNSTVEYIEVQLKVRSTITCNDCSDISAYQLALGKRAGFLTNNEVEFTNMSAGGPTVDGAIEDPKRRPFLAIAQKLKGTAGRADGGFKLDLTDVGFTRKVFTSPVTTTEDGITAEGIPPGETEEWLVND